MITPSPALRRAAALALLAAVLALVHFTAVAPLVSAWTVKGETIRSLRERLDRYTVLVAGAEALEAALAERRRLLETAPARYEGASETLVAAQVQDRLKAVVDEAGGVLSSARVLPPAEEGGFRRIGLKVQIDATLPVLQRILHALEAGRPYLTLDNLSLRPVPRPKTARSPAAEADPPLSVEMDVLAHALVVK